LFKAWPFRFGAGDLILKDQLTAGAFQGIFLKIRVLLGG
jgi:hypothetical protein